MEYISCFISIANVVIHRCGIHLPILPVRVAPFRSDSGLHLIPVHHVLLRHQVAGIVPHLLQLRVKPGVLHRLQVLAAVLHLRHEFAPAPNVAHRHRQLARLRPVQVFQRGQLRAVLLVPPERRGDFLRPRHQLCRQLQRPLVKDVVQVAARVALHQHKGGGRRRGGRQVHAAHHVRLPAHLAACHVHQHRLEHQGQRLVERHVLVHRYPPAVRVIACLVDVVIRVAVQNHVRLRCLALVPVDVRQHRVRHAACQQARRVAHRNHREDGGRADAAVGGVLARARVVLLGQYPFCHLHPHRNSKRGIRYSKYCHNLLYYCP